jgi:two-component system phosphate regulon response regulator PhoB
MTLKMARKIIIIEDDLDTLEIMSLILAEEGYEILSADNAKPLHEVHTHQPMLILMDNRLTAGSGGEFCKKFKNDPATMHFPVVLVSANMGLETIALECNADGYLKKPFDIADLIELVKRFS